MDEHDQSPLPGAPEAPPPSDHSLLRRIRGGSEDAATDLYLRYVHRVRALVRSRCSAGLNRRSDPDDIVQSVFRRFFNKVCQGDYDVPEGEELWGLLLVISLNKIRSEETYHRSAKRDVRLTHDLGDRAHDLTETVRRDESALSVLQLTLADVLAQLDPEQQQMFELRVQGHEINDIAQRLGRSKRTVERNLQNVRARLQSLLS